MRVLFVLHYPGYLRYFDSVMRALARRGATVRIAFEDLEKQREGLVALADAPARLHVDGLLPRRGDRFTGIARAIRTTGDALRYHDPDLYGCRFLRERMARNLHPLIRPLGRLPILPRPLLRGALALLDAVEAAVPRSGRVESWLRQRRPDVVVVSPLVTDGSIQVEVVKSCAALGIPTALAVASWDHLTTKGRIRVVPDRVLVWNEAQREEARIYHGVDPRRVVVTGAQPFDRWVGRRPARDRADFCDAFGLDPARPLLLFAGSTASISEPRAEREFVWDWLRSLDRHPDLARAGVLIRPHPYNFEHWRETAGDGLGPGRVLWPGGPPNPVDARDRSDYFDSLCHADAVIGINTSAMVEASLLERPVHTVLDARFADTQMGTRHFRHLLPETGGHLIVARDLAEHVRLLASSIAGGDAHFGPSRRFAAEFLGIESGKPSATSRVVAALEQLAAHAPLAHSPAPLTAPLTLLLGTAATLRHPLPRP